MDMIADVHVAGEAWDPWYWIMPNKEARVLCNLRITTIGDIRSSKIK